MKYLTIDQAINAVGLRIVLVQGMPSPWGQAAKAMMEYKGLSFSAAPQQGGGSNTELVAWSGVNSAPVVAWNDGAPLNRWDDILLLLERLEPGKPLIPAGSAERIQLFGMAHEICGELGFGWNRRLEMIQSGMKPGEAPKGLGKKYGYNDTDAGVAAQRSIDFMDHLTHTLKAQKALGSDYLIGQSVTAVDFYWAAFSNLVALQSAEQCPLDPAVRQLGEQRQVVRGQRQPGEVQCARRAQHGGAPAAEAAFLCDAARNQD